MRNLQVGSTRLLLAFFVVLGASMMTGCGGDETTTAPPTDASDATDSTDNTDSTDQTDGTDGGTEDATTGDDGADGTSATDDADSTDQADLTDDVGATSSSDGLEDVDATDGLDAGPGDATDSSDATDDVVETGCPGDCPLEANCEFCPLYDPDTQLACQDGPSANQACVDAMLASDSDFPQGSGGQIAFPSCTQLYVPITAAHLVVSLLTFPTVRAPETIAQQIRHVLRMPSPRCQMTRSPASCRHAGWCVLTDNTVCKPSVL